MEMNLQFESLSFRFATRLVFDRFSATLGPGVTWLRGANGKGKTTLLRLAAGALAPQAGGRYASPASTARASRSPTAWALSTAAATCRSCLG